LSRLYVRVVVLQAARESGSDDARRCVPRSRMPHRGAACTCEHAAQPFGVRERRDPPGPVTSRADRPGVGTGRRRRLKSACSERSVWVRIPPRARGNQRHDGWSEGISEDPPGNRFGGVLTGC
jgi:hypothetical protein